MRNRRSFLTGTFSGAGALLGFRLPAAVQGDPPEPWLRGLSGKHKQFFDIGVLNAGAPLGRVANFLNAYRDAYGVADADLNVLFGAHGDGIGFVFADAIWERFDLGARFRVDDPRTGKPARRNIFAATDPAIAGGNSVATLQSRNVRFLACRQTIGRLSRELAAVAHATPDETRALLEASLLPGVSPVPAMVLAANRAQEEGVAYMFVG